MHKPHLGADLPHVLFTSSSPWHSNKGMKEKVSLLLIYLSTGDGKHSGVSISRMDFGRFP